MTKLVFSDKNISQSLSKISDDELNTLDFGVTGLDNDCIVTRYNNYLGILSGVSTQKALGFHYFTNVGPCMNNFMVAQKLEDAIDGSVSLDETINYVLSVRMKPTKVKLRLIHDVNLSVNYVLILTLPQATVLR